MSAPTNPNGREIIPSPLSNEASPLEFAETTSVTMEWRVNNLKAIFDGTSGPIKSKCIKSAVFGDADTLWECIWYPNAGSPNSNLVNPPPTAQSIPPPNGANPNIPPGMVSLGSGFPQPAPLTSNGLEYCSFYLSAVPTQEEKDACLKGKWSRKGLYAFRFEIKTHNKGTVVAAKEAYNHVFSSKTVNWGWQSFARRDNLFYNAPPVVRQSDQFLVTCTVSSAATPPAGAWLNLPMQPTVRQAESGIVPSAFNASGSGWKGSEGAWRGIGGGNGAMGKERRLVPKDLVDAVGWLFNDETYSDVEFLLPIRQRGRVASTTPRDPPPVESDTIEDDTASELGGTTSTNTDQNSTVGGPSPVTNPTTKRSTVPFDLLDQATGISPATPARPHRNPRRRYRRIWANKKILRRSDYFDTILDGGFMEGRGAGASAADDDVDMTIDASTADESVMDSAAEDTDFDEEALSDHSTDDIHEDDGDLSNDEIMLTPARRPAGSTTTTTTHSRPSRGPEKAKLVIRDSAYRTWQALLYWLYTDTITFAPLASSFIPANAGGIPAADVAIRARKEWCDQWASERVTAGNQAQRPKPCSAKAIYRLADKFNLEPLKQRAFSHIISQLTTQNIPYEAFSGFSATYEQVRKIQVSYFLDHWAEIKSSPAMVNIWQAIRLGRHQGFEEVWPHIVSHLEFKNSDKDENGKGVSGTRDDY